MSEPIEVEDPGAQIVARMDWGGVTTLDEVMAVAHLFDPTSPRQMRRKDLLEHRLVQPPGFYRLASQAMGEEVKAPVLPRRRIVPTPVPADTKIEEVEETPHSAQTDKNGDTPIHPPEAAYLSAADLKLGAEYSDTDSDSDFIEKSRVELTTQIRSVEPRVCDCCAGVESADLCERAQNPSPASSTGDSSGSGAGPGAGPVAESS